VPIWTEKVLDKSGEVFPIHALAFNPTAPQLLVSSGPLLLLYDTTTWSLISTHAGHKDTIYAIDYSLDGHRCVTGGADKSVIVWRDMEAILKYSHSESIQSVKFNPVTGHVASCSGSDYGIWSADAKSVQKFKVRVRLGDIMDRFPRKQLRARGQMTADIWR
jgi:intraflagellar transport protein 122